MLPLYGSMVLLLGLGLFVGGVVFVALGVRGRPRLDAPTCAACRYDLRGKDPTSLAECPECGADLKRPGAVRFGRYVRSVKAIVIGLLLMMPIVLTLAYGMRRATRPPLPPPPPLTNAGLIATLAGSVQQPQTWTELEGRYGMGQLNDAEIAAVVDHLITDLNTRTVLQPLFWAESFTTTVLRDERISPEQLGRLCEAFYGAGTEMRMRDRVRTGRRGQFRLTINPWNLPGLARVAALIGATIDGEPIDLLDHSGRAGSEFDVGTSGSIGGQIAFDVEPGRYEAQFEVEIGVVPAGTDLGPRGRPGRPERWPDVVHRIPLQLTHSIEVVAESEPAIGLIRDPALAKQMRACLEVRSANLWAVADTWQLRLSLEKESTPPVSYAFLVIVRLGDEELELGTITGGSNSYSESGLTRRLEAVADSIETVDVILRPDIEGTESALRFDEIWAEEIVFEGVPLQRR